MSVSLENIYSQSIGLFDDPTITGAYQNTPIRFFKVMYTYYQNAVPRFNNPFTMQARLSLFQAPQGQIEIFNGDGTTITYHLSTTPTTNSYFNYMINGVKAVGTYDSVANNITFFSAIPAGQTGSCEWYDAGCILPDLLGNELDSMAQNILARLLVVCWAEKEKNFLLDIRRLLTDTDFRLISESNSLRAKQSWYEGISSSVAIKMNQYAWNMKLKNTFNL